ncbi:unnamed protein product (macronuclear) [Paramecium tetraurelia]|uniref:Uncharacterized protein n=1 Tax=Paramecium tetraurelia TaxID=5888 RepID=A0BSL2_PARTE|nr:uncharacterized protein GSPATT00031761001 [Paramecium tetraurelia]CAK61529.1 unnamed protein product [Paramecium tetraurelia]|eukprot:XP_001428927.1 hypothetical protein (macronuclear) [Paramecium tetraurelia strain d4-2]
MNFDFPFAEFKTPQKPYYVRSNHKHHSSQPQLSNYFTDPYENKQNLSKVGKETLKKWDFFSDPFSLPDKYTSKSQYKLKTESTDFGFDSIDLILGKQTDRHSTTSQVIPQKTQSEKLIGKKVQFSELVQVKNDDGSESEEPIQLLSRKETRKSKFSTQNQRPLDSLKKQC